MSLISSLLLDDSPVSSSTDVLKCSADGQFALVTRGAIYLVAPNFSPPKTQNGAPLQNDSLGWTKTAINDIGKRFSWSEDRAQWRTLSLGTVETVWQAVTWSPSGLNRLGGCLLATLTNNMEVTIWGPLKNPLTGEWVKLEDVTAGQISSYDKQEETSTEDILKCQTCSIAWSSSYYKKVTSTELGFNSLLALGSRSGDVNLFYWDTSTQSIRSCLNHSVFNAWIVRLEWSEWKPIGTTESEHGIQAYLACGLSNGSVWLLTVKQNPSSQEPYIVPDSILVMEADSRSITAMSFVDKGLEFQVSLAVAKPGFITICKLPGAPKNQSEMAEDPSLHMVLLSSPRMSLASSAVATCICMYYIASKELLIAVLAEGSTIAIADISRTGRVLEQNEGSEGPSTSELSKAMGRFTGQAEGRPIDRTEYARVHGFQFIGAGKYTVWAQEMLQSYDLSFRIQANFRTRICLAEFGTSDEITHTSTAEGFRNVLSRRDSLISYSPMVLLRELMLSLLDGAAITSAAPQLLPLLAPEWNAVGRSTEFFSEYLPIEHDALTSQVQLKLNLVLFLLNRPGLSNDMIAQLQSVRNALTEATVALRARLVAEKVLALNDTTGYDHASVLRFMYAVQYCPVLDAIKHQLSGVREQAQQFVRQNSPNVRAVANDGNGSKPPLELTKTADLGEACPVCTQSVAFSNLARARCQAGHFWERCATSLQLVSGIGSLTCSTCGRKSLDSDPTRFAEPGAHCVLCGGRYYRVL